MPDILVIGGSDAGISAALRIRELDPGRSVTVVHNDPRPNFSICGLPFHLGGEVPDARALAHRTPADLAGAGIDLLLEHTALALDAAARTVEVREPGGRTRRLSWNRLILCTGAAPILPPIPGIVRPGVFPVRTLSDIVAIDRWLRERRSRTAVVLGGGFIGLETAEALTRRGLAVNVLERLPEVLPVVDAPIAALVRAELAAEGVDVRTGTAVTAVQERGGSFVLTCGEGTEVAADMVIVGAGVRPVTDLAVAAGLDTGAAGAIRVNRRMATTTPDIFAAGDCAETFHRILGANGWYPLGTTAHRQGRIAGENACGGDREYPGTLGTQALKLFSLVAARTGLNDTEAARAGFDPLTVTTTADDHKRYYPGAVSLTLSLTGDRRTGRFLGLRIAGQHGAEIAKRVDIAAAALHHGMTLADLSDLDLSYTPPLSSPWDPVQIAAQAWEIARRAER